MKGSIAADRFELVEVGKLVQVVTFVQPTIRWAEKSGHAMLAGGLARLSSGVEIGST